MDIFKQSFKELKNTRTLTTLGILYAINIAMSYLSIPLTANLRIGFGFISMSMIGALFGPGLGMVSGLILDTLKFMVNPTGIYNPLWALTEICSGLIFGLVFYRKEITLWRCILAKGLVNMLVNCMLTPFLMNWFYGKGFYFYLTTRIVKNIILLPIEVVILYALLPKLVAYWRNSYVKNKESTVCR